MTYLDDLTKRLREGEEELLADLERVRAALRVLEGEEAREPKEAPQPRGEARLRVVRLPAATRTADAGKEAAVDDVLALLYLQFSDPRKIRACLSADISSVMRRLYDLRRDGLAEQIRGGWYPTDAARSLNWIENRAREIAGRLEA